MSEQRYKHSMSPRELFQLLLYQANQFEMFKEFIIEILDSRGVIARHDLLQLFEEFEKMNKSKLLHNRIIMNPSLEDMQIDVSLV